MAERARIERRGPGQGAPSGLQPASMAAAIAVLAVAAALRLWRLGEVPFGLHPDEAHNALDAVRILQGWRPVFLPGNNGREPLFMYLMAGTMTVAGTTVGGVRLAGAIAGIAAVAAQGAFAAAVAPARRARLAILSAGFAAVTFWPVALGRVGLRAGLLPAWVALALATWWRSIRSEGRPRFYWSVATGVFLAAAVYTHLIGRLLPIALVASAAGEVARDRRPAALGGLAAALVCAGVLLVPLGRYFAAHPAMLTYRAAQVSVLGGDVVPGVPDEAPASPGDEAVEGPIKAVAGNAARVAAAPLLRGDSSWYYNLPGRPIFDPLAGILFAVGALAWARDIAGRRGPRARSAAVLIGAALAVMASASILSVGAPKFVRMTGMWPVLFLWPASGLDAALETVRRHSARSALSPILATAAIGLSAWMTIATYFGTYARAPEAYSVMNGAGLERGRALAKLAEHGPLYASPTLWNQSVIRFACLASPPSGTVDLASGLILPGSGPARYAFDPADGDTVAELTRAWAGMARTDLTDGQGALSIILLTLPRDAWPGAAPLPTPANFGDRIDLVAADVPGTIRAGDELTVRLEWHALAPTGRDLNFFVHVVDPAGRGLGQFDGPPLSGSRGTDAWEPGERILQLVNLRIDADSAGQAEVVTGWYDWRDGKRLTAAGSPDGAWPIGRLDVEPADRG